MRAYTTFAASSQLRDWWNAQPGPSTSPFLRWEWFTTWADAFLPARAQLRLVVAEAHGAPAAAVAVYANGRNLVSLSNSHTPRFDAVHDPQEPGALDELADTLLHTFSLRLYQVPMASPLLHRITAAARPHAVLGTQDSPYLDLNGPGEDLLATRSRNMRQLIRRRARQLESLGPMSLDVTVGGPELQARLTEGFGVEASGWKGQAGTAITSGTRTEHFYRRLAEVAADLGWLRLFTLRVDGRPVAFAYHVLYANRLHLLKTGYVEDLGAGHAPGLVLTTRVLEWCSANGVAGYEFLGAAERWKTAWTDTVRPHESIVVYPTPVVGRVRAAVHARLHAAAVARRRDRTATGGHGDNGNGNGHPPDGEDKADAEPSAVGAKAGS